MNRTYKKSVDLGEKQGNSRHSQNHQRFWILFVVFIPPQIKGFSLNQKSAGITSSVADLRQGTFDEYTPLVRGSVVWKPVFIFFIHINTFFIFGTDLKVVHCELVSTKISLEYLWFSSKYTQGKTKFNHLFSVVSCDSAMTGWTYNEVILSYFQPLYEYKRLF